MSTLALCIPAYNAAWCLPRLLQSAKDQEIQFDEIIVYNDCSTDDTAAIAREYGASVITGSDNIGCSAGKNRLATVAKTDWLFFIDADDELYPNFTTVAHKWMNEKDAPDMVLMRYRDIDFSSGKIKDEPIYDRDALKRDAVKFTIENKIVNFELIKKEPFLKIAGFDTDPAILYIEDRAFSIKAALMGLSFDASNVIIGIKYYFSGSMSVADKAKWPRAGYHLWVKVNEAVGDRYNNEICHQLYQNAIWAGKANGWDTVKKSLQLAQKINAACLPTGSELFILAFKLFPFHAFYLREMIIRKFAKKDV
jgi:glycosyltransferase involved in cell wall biosynthesis